MINFVFFSYIIVGRVKDTFKTPAGCQVIEDTLSSEPKGLISDVVVTSITPSPRSKDGKGKVPRAWIVWSGPSGEGKKLSVKAVIKKLEVWYQKMFGDHVEGLHGGMEILDEVCVAENFKLAHFMISNLFYGDSKDEIWKTFKSRIAKNLRRTRE